MPTGAARAVQTTHRRMVVVLAEMPTERKPPGLAPHSYPPYVRSEQERRRWELATAIARRDFEGDGAAAIWMATRAIYNDRRIPT